ncbi:MAG: epoxide hydrolase [Hamadaea sp.]|nr:epoxide hydrolase [Hamadaea sp.]
MSEANAEVTPFRVDVPQADIDDLAHRLERIRWTEAGPGEEGADGVGLDWVRRLAQYWRDGYDWRAAEAKLNAYPQFTTEIDGQTIHFLHVRSAHPGAFPVILTHGWPGSVVEYLNLIEPLTDPTAHGGDPADAFDVVIPSLPGYGFSRPVREPGWTNQRIAAAWAELMRRLGYDRYGAVGNDAGSMIGPELGRLDGDRVTGVHVTQVFSFPSGDPSEFEGLSDQDMTALQQLQWFYENKFSFNQVQSQQPQTLAHALADSPAGLLAWNGQLFGSDAGVQDLDDDFVLTNVAIYWFTNTAGSAMRLYFENTRAGVQAKEPTTVPLGLAGFKGDFWGIRKFAERDHANVAQWNVYDEPGGHYAAHLYPEVLAADVRGFFRGRR